MKTSNPIQLTLKPLYKTIAKGKPCDLDVLMQVEGFMAEAKDEKAREAMNLAVVIDCSGSMAGRPLEDAKQATLALIERLRDDDRISVVTYSDNAQVVLESMLVSSARGIAARAIGNIRTQGMTALHSGWLAGASQLAPMVGQYSVNRILLLSDGCANVGKTDPDEIAREAAQLASEGISTSSYGIGNGFNEVLMTGLAQAGEGLAFYASDSDQMQLYFADEFGIASQIVARSVGVKAHVVAGDKTIHGECLNMVGQRDGLWRLNPVLAGAASWCVVRFHLPQDIDAESVQIMAQAAWTNPKSETENAQADATVKLGKATGKPDKQVKDRSDEASAARMAQQVAQAARQGDIGLMNATLTAMSAVSASNAYVGGIEANLRARVAEGNMNNVSKEACYSSTTLSRRVVEQGDDDAGFVGRYGMKRVVQSKKADGDQGGDKAVGKGAQ